MYVAHYNVNFFKIEGFSDVLLLIHKLNMSLYIKIIIAFRKNVHMYYYITYHIYIYICSTYIYIYIFICVCMVYIYIYFDILWHCNYCIFMSTSSHLPMKIVVHCFIRCVNGSGSLQLHHCHGVPGAARKTTSSELGDSEKVYPPGKNGPLMWW